MKRVFDFLRYRHITVSISVLLLIGFSAGTFMRGGFNFGVDFVGGVKITASFEAGVNESSIRDILKDFSPMVQQIGIPEKNEYIISVKLPQGGDAEQESEKVKKVLSATLKNVNFLSVENVGPAIGNILKRDAVKAMIIAMLLMSVYLAFRFEMKYSLGTMVAVIHDVVLSLAFCGIMGIEINIPVIAALLTIFGYSVNDTIVIFDRIRENVSGKSKLTFGDTINKSISQSMSRTILTTATTLFSVAALYFIGGTALNEFALVLLVGMVFGTYSTIFIASPVILTWERLAKR